MGSGSTRHRIARALVALSAAATGVLAASCANLSQPAPDRAFFAIDLSAPPRAASSAAPHQEAPTASPGAAVLRVRRLRVAAPYDRSAFVYRTRQGPFRADYYNGFIADPAELLTQGLLEWLSSAGLPGAVVGATSGVPARYSLEGTVTALYGNYTAGRVPEAVVALRLVVFDDAEGRVVLQKEYAVATPIKPADAASLVKGWGGGWGGIFSEITTDLAALQPSSVPTPAAGS
jgi:ABC-type uncharacterized transport system auxiliary subunit